MAQLNTLATSKIEISASAQNSDLTQSGFGGLSYTEIGFVGSIGAYGNNTNIVSYNTLNTAVSQKQKGITNAGDPEIEAARDDTDAGQIAATAAGEVSDANAYAFRVTKQDGAIDYLRGVVSGPVYQNGRNEDFDLIMYTLGLVQEVIHV